VVWWSRTAIVVPSTELGMNLERNDWKRAKAVNGLVRFVVRKEYGCQAFLQGVKDEPFARFPARTDFSWEF
jgi:hypothetical protein